MQENSAHLTEKAAQALGLVSESTEPSSIHKIVGEHLAESFPALAPEADHSPELAHALARSDEYAVKLVDAAENTPIYEHHTVMSQVLLGLDKNSPKVGGSMNQYNGELNSFDSDQSLIDLLTSVPEDQLNLVIFNMLTTALTHPSDSSATRYDPRQRTMILIDLIQAADLHIQKSKGQQINSTNILKGLGKILEVLTIKLGESGANLTSTPEIARKLVNVESVVFGDSSRASSIAAQALPKAGV